MSSLLPALVISAYVPSVAAFMSSCPQNFPLIKKTTSMLFTRAPWQHLSGSLCKLSSIRNLGSRRLLPQGFISQRSNRSFKKPKFLSFVPNEKSDESEMPVLDEANVRIVTYNVLSSSLADTSYYTICNPKDLDDNIRYRRVASKIVSIISF